MEPRPALPASARRTTTEPRQRSVLYVSRLCPEARLASLVEQQAIRASLQEQKFHGLLARGLAESGEAVTALSVLPPGPDGGWRPATGTETEAGIAFRFLSLRAVPILSHAVVFAWSFASCLAWARARRRGPRVVVCDVLDLSISAGALVAARLAGIPAVALVTDVPALLHGYIGTGSGASARGMARLYRALASFFTARYSGYVVLTEAMNALVNPRGRPHLVVEGLADPAMAERENTLDGKASERVVLYAGALYCKYGVGTLLDAFLQVPLPEARLQLYGAGELESVLPNYEARDPRIRYGGVRPNPEIVGAEVRATLLVNPRPSDEAFTRFSFPSKNMEYMASGTPVVTTRLPGMPEAYLEHVYTFPDETAEGMACTLAALLSLPREELHRKGEGAKAFVLGHKTSRHQAGRIQALFQEVQRARA